MNFHPIFKSKNHKEMLAQALSNKVIFFYPNSAEIETKGADPNWPLHNRYGFSSEDVNLYWEPSIEEFIKGNIESYKDGYNLYTENKKTFLSKVIASFKAVKFIHFSFNWAVWFWVIDSLDTVSHDIIKNKLKKLSRKEQESFDYLKELNKITYNERIDFVNEHYVKVNNNMWVSENDPTCLIYDPQSKPYQLKHGWSMDQLGEIIEEWVFVMTKTKVHAIYKESFE